MSHGGDYRGEIHPSGDESQSEKECEKMMKKKGSDVPKYCFSINNFRLRPKEFCNRVVQIRIFEAYAYLKDIHLN